MKFIEIVSSHELPVVVELWAPWCAPCRAMAPWLGKVEAEFSGRVDLIRLNTDEDKDLLRDLSVWSIPTLIGYWKGQQIFRLSGVQTESALREIFNAALAHRPPRGLLSMLERVYRLIIASGLIAIGLVMHSWLLLGLGGVVFILGIYDRCPIILSLLGKFK